MSRTSFAQTMSLDSSRVARGRMNRNKIKNNLAAAPLQHAAQALWTRSELIKS